MADIEEEYDIYESYEKINSEIRKYSGRENQIPKNVLEKTAQIALFVSITQSREGTTIGWIKWMLGEIKDMGYPVKPYSKMKKREAEAYLQKIKNDIRYELESRSPEVLKDIEIKNKKRLENFM